MTRHDACMMQSDELTACGTKCCVECAQDWLSMALHEMFMGYGSANGMNGIA